MVFFLWGGMDGHGALIEPPPDPGYPSMLNAQKLALTLVPVAQQTGAIKVSGGTQDGIYPVALTYAGKPWYELLGKTADLFSPPEFAIRWTGDQWMIWGEGATPLYYSLSDVATPDLAADVLGVVTIDFNDLTIPDDSNPVVNRYGSIVNNGATNGSFIVELDANLTLNESYVSWNLTEGNLLTGGVKVHGDGTDQPTKQQIINKLVSIGGGRITDLGGLKISVVLTDHLADTMDFSDMTSSHYTVTPQPAWFNASDDTAASITVALATSSDMIDYGQSVQVTDGFVVSGFGDLRDGFYAAVGNSDPNYNTNGKPFYQGVLFDPDNNSFHGVGWNGVNWGMDGDGVAIGDTSFPWQADWSGDSATLTHPAVQTLQPPSDSFVVSGAYEDGPEGAIFNGRWTRTGTQHGKSSYVLLGLNTIYWDGTQWIIDNQGDHYYFSTDLVPEPWLVTTWQVDAGTGASFTLTPSPNADPTVVVVSGAGTAEANGLWKRARNSIGVPLPGNNGTYIYTKIEDLAGDTSLSFDDMGDGTFRWEMTTPNARYISTDDVLEPWMVTTWVVDIGDTPTPTVTATIAYPALFVANAGTAEANGIYTYRGLTVLGSSTPQPYYKKLGASDADSPDDWIIYLETGAGWHLDNPDDSQYRGTEVVFPWSASWSAIAGTAPAPSVTPITAAELAAGLRVSNDGVTNGASYVSQPFHGRQYYMGLNGGGSNNLHWDTDFNVWTDDVGVWTTSNVAFPWQGADSHTGHNGATFARDDVAAETNWQ